MHKNRINVSLKMALCLFVLILFAIACGDGDSVDGDQTDGDAEESEMDDDSGELNIIIDGDDEKEVEYFNPTGAKAFRFTSFTMQIPERLEFQVPIIDLPFDIKDYLAKSMTRELESHETNIILVPEKENLADYPYNMLFATAVAIEGEDESYTYSLHDYEQYTLAIIRGDSREQFDTDKGQVITTPIGRGMSFELEDAQLSGTYTDEGIEKGALAGVISRRTANEMELYQGFTLESIFNSMEMVPDYTFENGELGYSFIFVFEAEPVELAD